MTKKSRFLSLSQDLAYLSACYSIFISDNYQNKEIKTLNMKNDKKKSTKIVNFAVNDII